MVRYTQKKTIITMVYIILSLFLFEVPIFASDQILDTFLLQYFETSEYSYEKYKISKYEMIFAYRFINVEKRIADKVLVFIEENNNSYKPILYISDNNILNMNGKIIFHGILPNQELYGWVLRIVEKNNSFATVVYGNRGNTVTDGPIIIWDDKTNDFKQYLVDKSMW